MKYVALLRGVNVGGNRKVEMKRLKSLFGSLGCKNVETYLNSGNVIFETNRKRDKFGKEISGELSREFGFDIQILIKSQEEMGKVYSAIPIDWKNDANHKTDVAYLFSNIDSIKIVDELPLKKDFIRVKYAGGAIIWNVRREDYNKSNLNKIIGLKCYKFMTVRNINTARFLATGKK